MPEDKSIFAIKSELNKIELAYYRIEKENDQLKLKNQKLKDRLAEKYVHEKEIQIEANNIAFERILDLVKDIKFVIEQGEHDLNTLDAVEKIIKAQLEGTVSIPEATETIKLARKALEWKQRLNESIDKELNDTGLPLIIKQNVHQIVTRPIKKGILFNGYNHSMYSTAGEDKCEFQLMTYGSDATSAMMRFMEKWMSEISR